MAVSSRVTGRANAMTRGKGLKKGLAKKSTTSTTTRKTPSVRGFTNIGAKPKPKKGMRLY